MQVLSKSALKNKKRKEAAKAAKLAEAAIPVQRYGNRDGTRKFFILNKKPLLQEG